jgi:hypothetical protein
MPRTADTVHELAKKERRIAFAHQTHAEQTALSAG